MPRPVKRGYDARGRLAHARETQRHIADAARELFIERGYVATSVRDIAERAGVSVQTLYNGFDGKAAIWSRIFDIAVAGDDEPVPLAQRPSYRAILAERDPVRVIEKEVAFFAAIAARVAPLMATAHAAIDADPDVAAQWQRMYLDARHEGVSRVAEHLRTLRALRRGVTSGRAADVIWTVLSFETYGSLVTRRGWTSGSWERWARGVLVADLLGGGD